MSRTDQRRRRVLRAVAPVAGLLAVGLLVWQGSYAAFSATTNNTGDSWATGALTRNDARHRHLRRKHERRVHRDSPQAGQHELQVHHRRCWWHHSAEH